jgi:serine protease Do
MISDYKPHWRLITAGTLAVIVVTFIATIGSLYFLSATPGGEKLRDRFGLGNLKTFTIETSRTQKIVVEESSAIIDANKKVQPSVVSITSTSHAVRDIFGFGTIQAPQTAGTGFIVSVDGLIATNKHVIGSGDTFTVTTTDGKSFDGKVVATDPTNDIALLKVDAHGLPVVDLGDSNQTQVGQWVIAIGNALGELQNTVTVGVISAKERTAEPSDGQGNTESLAGLLQTDAAINPGNSGGPLLNLNGQVIGINTAIAGNAQNIGFAIPANDIKKDLQSYQKNGKIVQPYIGVRYQSITKALATSLGLPVEKGALLSPNGNQSSVVAGSPAEAAGLKDNDIITKVNNDEITESVPLTELIRKYNPGDKISLAILRDKKPQIIQLTLGELGK